MKKMILLAAILLVASAAHGQKPTKFDKLLGFGVYAASEFDGATTLYVLNHCPAGVSCTEGNPIMATVSNTPAIFAVMAGSGWAVNRVSKALRNRGHRRYARGVQIFAIGLHIVAGAHNLHAMR